jgi:hypothetical protein
MLGMARDRYRQRRLECTTHRLCMHDRQRTYMTRRGNIRVADLLLAIFEEHALRPMIAQQEAMMLLSRNAQGGNVDPS